MSVSDPLIRRLKGIAKQLTLQTNPVDDDSKELRAFCELLETIFRKGLNHTNSIFARNRKDYWNWIVNIVSTPAYCNKTRPCLSFDKAIDETKNSKKVTTNQGRGRLFIRLALQYKCLSVPVDFMKKTPYFQDGASQTWYRPETSILGDEILCEIFLSVLHGACEINFELETKNASFLDNTWELPVYKTYELVPCHDLGLQICHYDNRIIVSGVDPGGVCEEDNKIQIGDILDECLDKTLRSSKRGMISTLLKRNQGFPVRVSIVKCHLGDGSLFHPIKELLKAGGLETTSILQYVQKGVIKKKINNQDTPPHALLPEDGYDELIPVHNAEDGAVYNLRYKGKISVGQDGGIHMIEGAIAKIVNEKENPRDVLMNVSEGLVTVMDSHTKEVLFTHSFTKIASCGRRMDLVKYFAYLAGETTCTLAKEFIAYIFESDDENEVKTILCSIAQGFDRTHWSV